MSHGKLSITCKWEKKKKNYLKNPIKFKKTGRTELKVRKGVIRLSLIYTTGGMYFF